jgi:precorrin-2 dehydrogenase / sirohydrochlorin ferrochelatase
VSDDYQLVLRLAGRHCVVVGGGVVATRKVQGLLSSDANVTVVAPGLSTELEDLVAAGRVRAERRPFEPADVDGAVLAFAATDSREVNRTVAEAARARGALVNVADDPAACDFTVPALVRRGDVTLAVSTGGRSPAFARFLREQLEGWLTDSRCELLELLAELRRELRAEGAPVDASRWQAAIADDAVTAALETGDRDAARRRLRAILTSGG